MENKFTKEEMEFIEAMRKSILSDVEAVAGTKAAEQIEKNIKAAIDEMSKTNKGHLQKIEALEKSLSDLDSAMKKNQEWIDKKISEEKKKVVIKASGIADAIEQHADVIKGYAKKRATISIELDYKTVGDIGAGNFTVSGTPAFVHGGALSEPGRKPYEQRHIREFLRPVPLGTGQDHYVIRDAGGEGGPGTVAAGAAKPQSDRDWVKTIVPVTKVAHYYKLPEEYLQDIPWLQDEITNIGIEELLAKEDTLLLTNNTSGEFLGLNQSFNSTAFSVPGSLAGVFTGSIVANNYDVLVAAWTQLRNLKGTASLVLMNPADYAAMILHKDTTGQYPFGAPNQNIPNLFGAPIVAHTAVTSDKFFIGDFSMVRMGIKSALSIRFYDQNEDDAIKNMVTVVIEERITMAADRADKVIYGDFSDGRAALES